MGGGSWTKAAFTTYATTAYNACVSDVSSAITTNLSNQDIFKSRGLVKELNPYKVVRQCADSEEHPNTIPVILALDVTGSMGDAAVEVAKKLGTIMQDLYGKITDVEFMTMGIGDLSYDDSPIQASQFESDIRIMEQLDKIYFEFGGGGNNYESYTSAWYFGLHNTDLDCYTKRGKKGIIITMGDERLNPYLHNFQLNSALGSTEQGSVETPKLYEEASKKFDIYHIDVNHRVYRDEGIDSSWAILGDNYKKANMNNISDIITEVIISSASSVSNVSVDEEGCITW